MSEGASALRAWLLALRRARVRTRNSVGLLSPVRNVLHIRCLERRKRGFPIRPLRVLAALAVVALTCHCGSSTPAPNSISIANFQYSPSNLSVAPGTVVTVTNVTDGMNHSLTSQSVLGSYVAAPFEGVQFDTGQFQGSASFTIPSTATVGIVIPYFCTVHTNTMGMGQGQITIVAAP